MGKLALVFPGQGSQAVGMGAKMAREHSSAADIYLRAAKHLGWPIDELCFNGPAEKLNRTEYAQPALYVNSMAAMAVLSERGIVGDVVCGHSLGEYSALAAAGALAFEAGLELVARRGEEMARAAARHPGSMAAIIGLEDAVVEDICREAGDVWAVNYNCPGQLVISGESGALQRAIEAARAAGARKAVELAVSGSFHSPLMQDAADAMRQMLAGTVFAEPRPPFLSSISCGYEKSGDLAELLVRQIVSPVRWRQSVEQLIADGVDRFFEVGNGKVLCGLIRRINRDVTTMEVSDADSLEKAAALV